MKANFIMANRAKSNSKTTKRMISQIAKYCQPIKIRGVKNNSLSAKGSMTLPKLVTWFLCRAKIPSQVSVIAAKIKNQS